MAIARHTFRPRKRPRPSASPIGSPIRLASALLEQFNYTANEPYASAIALVLLALIVVLVGILTVLQQRTGGIRLRFRAA